MQALKPKKTARKLSNRTRLSPKELRRVADELVAAKDPSDISDLKRRLERGFYGDLEHA